MLLALNDDKLGLLMTAFGDCGDGIGVVVGDWFCEIGVVSGDLFGVLAGDWFVDTGDDTGLLVGVLRDISECTGYAEHSLEFDELEGESASIDDSNCLKVKTTCKTKISASCFKVKAKKNGYQKSSP